MIELYFKIYIEKSDRDRSGHAVKRIARALGIAQNQVHLDRYTISY